MYGLLGEKFMKVPAAIVLTEMLLLLYLPGWFLSYSYGNKSDLADECEARCAAVDGESRYQCLKTCINTKRKNEPVGEDNVKRRMDTCEDACGDFTGVDKIRCIRLCLDRRKDRVVIKRDAVKKENENPCETRCGVLSGISKQTCMARCERELRFDQKDPTRHRKK
jgi:hypothetical protein